MRRTGATLGIKVVAALLMLAPLALVAPSAVAQDRPGPDSAATQELAERYAPVLRIREQAEECDTDGERFGPVAVDSVLDNDQILLRQVGANNPVMTKGPGAGDLFDVGEGFYLDFPGDALAPGCIYERDVRRYTRDLEPTVYAHVATQDDAPGRLALQYWFFWYYNDWNNKHEGDWEGIQLLFEADTVEEALASEPISVGYAQHEGGERADWDDGKLERQGARPVVYPSVGSHASYFSSALYLGRSGSEGFGCDTTDGPSREVDPAVVVLPDQVDDPSDPLAWLGFEGRWGERRSGPFNGPTGPMDKERWTEPVDWHDQLRATSVIIPGGDGDAAVVANRFCGVVDWGSRQLITLTLSPVVFLIGVVLVVVIVGALLRRTDWTPVDPLPIERRRRAGQIIKAAARLYRSSGTRFLEVGLVYLPIALGVGVLVGLIARLPVVRSLVDGDIDIGIVGVLLTIAVGTLGHTVGSVIATATTATLMRGTEEGDDLSAAEAYRRTFGRLGDLLRGLLRAIAYVVFLLVTIVGIPWGLRQLVRYQFLAPAVALEGLGGQAALDRSSQLVRGRWFHVAGVVLLLNGVVFLVNAVVGLLLLVLLSGIPLWAFSVIVTVFAALVVPYASIGLVLVYGDAVAQSDGIGTAEPLEPAGGARAT